MSSNIKFILIGNYVLDRWESMERFAQMLKSGFIQAGFECEIWRPKVLFGACVKSGDVGIGKWLGYIDKWLLFPLLLRWRLRNRKLRSLNLYFHICDHSNAFYLKHVPVDRTGITCHDVLAIRGSLGHKDAYSPATNTGKLFQKWILHHLCQAKLLAAVSELTFMQLKELTSNVSNTDKNWRVIPLGLNNDFGRLSSEDVHVKLQAIGLEPTKPFILHVGSNLPRKNRKLLLDMVADLGSSWSGNICFAGEEIDESLLVHARLLNLQNRVLSIIKPDHTILMALYNACQAFIFPSFSEGFGWPIIEAQACGAPVITSNIQPMPEVGGSAALYADPNKPKDFAKAFLLLKDPTIRQKLIQEGFQNRLRFEPFKMINSYLLLHGLTSVDSYCSNIEN